MLFLEQISEKFEEEPGLKWAKAIIRNFELIELIKSCPLKYNK